MELVDKVYYKDRIIKILKEDGFTNLSDNIFRKNDYRVSIDMGDGSIYTYYIRNAMQSKRHDMVDYYSGLLKEDRLNKIKRLKKLI